MKKFAWIPFYEELAEKLLDYKDKRKRRKLVQFVYSLGEYSRFIHSEDGSEVNDIDPYTMYSVFNRGQKAVTRMHIMQLYKEYFGIKSPIPNRFDGIPVMDNRRSTFFARSESARQIPLLWELFESEINGDKKQFIRSFDSLQQTKGIKWNITIGAYWVKPLDYMPLDQYSRNYLINNDYDVFDENNLNGEKYLNLIDEIKKDIKKKRFESIPAISDIANEGDVEDEEYIENNIVNEDIQQYTDILRQKKNIILQGAPGTGKTYNTAALALSICGESIPESHDEIMQRYDDLQKEGRIGFCTFHQSMDYEDFVEGIKAKTVNETVTYDVEDGIFKIMCANANKITTENKSEKIDFTKTRVFKMSLGEKGKDGDDVFDYCISNNVVALGWGGDKDFSKCERLEDFKALDETWGATAMTIFKQWMRKGDIILVSNGTKEVKAIAKIVGEYEFRDDAPIDMYQFRKVEWLYIGEMIPISKLYHKNLSQQSIYAFYDSKKEGKSDYNSIKTDVLNNIITGAINDEKPQNYVLIIDEINRGNVSRIFGELITLLEKDKRLGGEHPIKVTLPYSKESFGVPENLYIIGTMNTTDRSVGNIDYAVRRRFAFATLQSKRDLVEQYSKAINAVNLFDAVKSFIEKNKTEMDFEDLMVGHSYFFAKDDDELALRWQYEILPLLNEYVKDDILRAGRLESNMSVDEFVRKNGVASDDEKQTEQSE